MEKKGTVRILLKLCHLPVGSVPLKEGDKDAKDGEEEEEAEDEVEEDGVDQGEAEDGGGDDKEGHDEEEDGEPLVLVHLGMSMW